MLLTLLIGLTSSVHAADLPGRSPPPSAPPRPSMMSADGAISPPDDMIKLRDPFKRPDSEIAKVIARSELENYGVDAFKMVAVLTGPSKMRALLLANDGKSFLVHTGMRIGQRNGVILKITSEKVVVREKIANVLGQQENFDSEITLQSDNKNGGKTK